MRKLRLGQCGLLIVSATFAAAIAAEEHPEPYFGESLWYAHQGQWFEALQRLDSEMLQHGHVDEPELDSLYPFIDDAHFSLGDFELRYRMHHRAGRAISAVLEGAVDERIRNDAAYRLARIHFQKGQLDDALVALSRIDGRIPEGLDDDIRFLHGSILLDREQPAEAAEIFADLQDSDEFGVYAAYNLGIASLRSGRVTEAQAQLQRAGQFDARDAAGFAARDKANLVLGTLHLENERYAEAATTFDRVRLDGPYSNQALLSSGWASVSGGDYERAVVPWRVLADRDVTDAAAQEARLALPYAYGNLGVHGKAAIYYGDALDSFGVEVDKLNDSIQSIREGRFLEALIREEIRHSEEWVIRLRSLPQAPETYYLATLLASHEFQTGLQNYLDLSDLRRKLVSWQTSFDAFDDMVAIRGEHYEPLLPEVDTAFRELDSRMRLRREQYRMLVKHRDDLLTKPHPEFLATPEERDLLARLDELQASLAAGDGTALDEALAERIGRLRGLLVWTIETEYHARLTEFDRNLRSLDEAMAVADAQYGQYVRTRQEATHSFDGYDLPIRRLRARVTEALAGIDRMLARQGYELEIVAIDELVVRRDRLGNFRDKARFALADSYDRATQAQARSAEQ